MRVTVHPDRCCSSGLCVLTAPEVFDQSDTDGTVLLLQPHPPSPLDADVRTAADTCPGQAITVEED